MRIVSIVSQKGGAGKTTIAVNLAVAAAASGVKGTLIDLDPQATAANWGDRRQTAAPQVISAQAARLSQILKLDYQGFFPLTTLDKPSWIKLSFSR